MRTFLLWQAKGAGGPEPEVVARRVAALLAPLFRRPPALALRSAGAGPGAWHLLLLSLPMPGWRRPYTEEDAAGWAEAIDFPLDVDHALAAEGLATGGRPLLALARAFATRTEALLPELSPPFFLLWGAPGGDALHAQIDALGQSQVFAVENQQVRAFTNRLLALKTLDVALEPVAQEWAARLTLGYFPWETSGFRGIARLSAGTRLRLDARGVERWETDVLASWLRPPAMTPSQCLELARESVRGHLRSVLAYSERPVATLTGGRDSRAVVATLIALGADFDLKVKGPPASDDVVVAVELARQAGLDLIQDTASEVPSDDAADWRRSIELGLLWQAGHTDPDKHKAFFRHGGFFEPAGVHVTGQHGEIGRATYIADFLRLLAPRGLRLDGGAKSRLLAEKLHQLLQTRMIAKIPTILRPEHKEPLRETIRAMLAEGRGRYGLSSLECLELYYLRQVIRRNLSGSLSSQPYQVAAPFLSPGFLRAAFAWRWPGKEDDVFHGHLVATQMPAWTGVRYTEKDGSSRRQAAAGARKTEIADRFYRQKGSEYYDAFVAWETIGAPLFEGAFEPDGFLAQVYDREAAREQWQSCPDELILLHLLPGVLAR